MKPIITHKSHKTAATFKAFIFATSNVLVGKDRREEMLSSRLYVLLKSLLREYWRARDARSHKMLATPDITYSTAKGKGHAQYT